MDKKGAFMELIKIVLIIASVIGIAFILITIFVPGVKEQKEPLTCGASLMAASQKFSIGGTGLPSLKCEKIPVEIKSDKTEEINKELLKLVTQTIETFNVRKVFSGVTGIYCRRRYHPITFSTKGLVIKDFGDYLKKNLPSSLVKVLKFYPTEIDTNKEYSVLFVVAFEGYYDKLIEGKYKSLFLYKLGIEKFESQYLGFALVESSKIQDELKCNHLI